MIAMVSNMRFLQSSASLKSKLNAALCRTRGCIAIAVLLGFLPTVAAAQVDASSTAPSRGNRAADTVKFLAGGALALGMHEGGHLVLDAVFGANAGIKKITFGPFPFFAITHHPISPRREFAVSS